MVASISAVGKRVKAGRRITREYSLFRQMATLAAGDYIEPECGSRLDSRAAIPRGGDGGAIVELSSGAESRLRRVPSSAGRGYRCHEVAIHSATYGTTLKRRMPIL
jgi:hypothetical protein